MLSKVWGLEICCHWHRACLKDSALKAFLRVSKAWVPLQSTIPSTRPTLNPEPRTSEQLKQLNKQPRRQFSLNAAPPPAFWECLTWVGVLGPSTLHHIYIYVYTDKYIYIYTLRKNIYISLSLSLSLSVFFFYWPISVSLCLSLSPDIPPYIVHPFKST